MRREVFATPGHVRLAVRVPAGEIDLETWDAPETSVELEALRGPSEGAVEDARVEVRERGDGHDVVVEVERRPPGFHIGRGASVRIAVRLPHGASVEASSAAADVNGRGRFAEVEVKTASGDVAFDDVAGGARIKAVSGDIRVARVGGDASIQSVSGDVRIDRIEGSGSLNSVSGDIKIAEAGVGLRLQSVSGDQSIEAAAQGEFTMQSVSGDLRLGVREGSKLFVDARSTSGKTNSELAIGDEPPANGGPLVELRAKSISGDIRIVRA